MNLHTAVMKYGSIRAAGRELGIPESTLRRRLKKEPLPELPDNAFVPDNDIFAHTHTDEDKVVDLSSDKVQRFIVTSAQNNVEVHEGFLKNLEVFAAHLGADLMVSYCLYDKNGYRGVVARDDEQALAKRDVWFDKRTKPYATNQRTMLARRLAFCGELDILATARNPLSGLESYCGRSSIIVPHNKFAFHCVESRKHQMPKEMFTTGSVTPRRFIQRKAGQLAHFHHVLGALLVEVQETGHWHVHHLNAEDDGSFYWLNNRVQDGEVIEDVDGIAGLILGDIHIEKGDSEIIAQTARIITDLFPDTVVLHDLIDFRSRNHHNRNDPLFRIRMEKEGATVKAELLQAADFINTLSEYGPSDMRVVVARGNHDLALDRWVKETHWQDDPTNARLYLELATGMVEYAHHGMPFNALAYSIEDRLSGEVQFLGLDESYEIEGIECGMHGHIGPSGARGMPKQFSRMGFKTFTAHTHTPSIYDGAYTVGVTGSLHMGYNVGPSKWLHCHGIIYPNGKRAFIFLKNGKYRV